MSDHLQIQHIPIEQLELDKENPRIRKWIEHYGGSPTFDQMLLALGLGSSDPESGSSTTFQSLRESIRAQGGLINPIIVEMTAAGKKRVVEGNTRLAIYMAFDRGNIPGNWKTIPAIVHDSIEQEQIDAIRLQCHIVGPRPWDPYSKAKYLDHLLNIENMPLSRIVDLCGGRKREITDFVDAYKDMEQYYRPILESDSDFDVTRFSAFVELQKPRIKEAIFATSYTLTDFSEWIRDRKIDPLNTVRALPRILANQQAKAKFLTVGAREALKILEVPVSPALTNIPLEQLLRVTLEKLHTIPWREVEAMREDSGGAKAQLLQETQQALSDICNEFV